MSEIHETGLARLKLLWPERRAELQAQWVANAQFRELCEAYELAFAGLEHWIRAPKPVAPDRVAEYNALIAATEQDIIETLR